MGFKARARANQSKAEDDEKKKGRENREGALWRQRL